MVQPGTTVKLSDYKPDETFGYSKGPKADEALARNVALLDELQAPFAAEKKRALLIVLQGMDTCGKDGTIRHVMSGLNPQGCKVISFKQPSSDEANHDFLWRIHKGVPGYGEIGIFNRSHYEQVLVVRVHKLEPKETWSAHYKQINRFEKNLAENNVAILKFFLHISKDEQKRRLEQRIEDKARNWKLAPNDFKEREFWGDYMDAYEGALSNCSTAEAPWFVIPANHKWFRNIAVSSVITEKLEEMNPKYPKPAFDISHIELK
jgi:PPK2 family polyphosphate:nucleotide phosphotransferase